MVKVDKCWTAGGRHELCGGLLTHPSWLPASHFFKCRGALLLCFNQREAGGAKGVAVFGIQRAALVQASQDSALPFPELIMLFPPATRWKRWMEM